MHGRASVRNCWRPIMNHAHHHARSMIRVVACIFALLATLRLAAADTNPAANWSRDDAAHLLRRAAFGGTPQQIDAFHNLGRDAAVEYLLTNKLPDGVEPIFLKAELKPFEVTPQTAN